MVKRSTVTNRTKNISQYDVWNHFISVKYNMIFSTNSSLRGKSPIYLNESVIILIIETFLPHRKYVNSLNCPLHPLVSLQQLTCHFAH